MAGSRTSATGGSGSGRTLAGRTMEDVAEERAAQRRRAWQRSRDVRAETKLVRAMLKRRQIDPYELVRGSMPTQTPEVAAQLEAVVARWRLDSLLLALPGIGPARKQEVLAIFRASPRTRLGTLTFERRSHLADLIKAAVEIV